MRPSHPPNRWLNKVLATGALISLMGINLLASGSAGVARNTLSNGQTLTRALNVPNVAQNIFGPSGPTSPIKPYGAEVIRPSAFGSVDSLANVAATFANPTQPRIEEDLNILPKVLIGSQKVGADGALQDTPGTVEAMGAPIANFDGLTIAESGGFLPPDTNGDIGYDPGTGKRYYFEWVNVFYKAWDVTNPAAPSVVISPTAGNTLWAAGLPGTGCANNNDGDPVVLFDEQAHRWMITQFDLGASFSGPFHECIAVSKTPDPTGAWWVYQYNYRDAATYLNDYPHFGVWPDPTYNAYYMTVHQFNASGTAWLGQAVGAFDRAKLLAGDSSSPLVVFDLFSVNQNFGGMLPADLDGAPPPNGTPGLFFEVDDDSAGMGADAMRVWEFRPNWATPASSTFGISGQPNYTVTVASFNLLPCTTNNLRTCIPQSGSSQKLDAIGDRLMYRAAFRQVGNTQSVVINHTVWADGTDRAGVRWYEARRNPGTGAWSINQQGTYAPADGLYRWMGSIAMDMSGNIALGYSASGTTINPAIRYTGRSVSDPLNTLPQTEMTLTTSSGAQTSTSSRWGDYSMMGVDPQDGCTFWYTQEYHGATASSAWRTRIGSFKFNECGGNDFYVSPQVTTQTICQSSNAVYPIGVGSTGGFNSAVTMSAVGNPGSATFVPNPVTPPPDGITTTVLTINGATAGNYTFGITGTSGITEHGTSLALNVVGGIASVPTLVGPADGATNISPNVMLTWTASAGAATYYLEVATDPGFATIVYTATVAGTTHTTGALAPNTTFYWRVRTANVCGTSTFSSPFSFTTASLGYQTVCTSPNQPIADNTTATTTLNVPTGGNLIDLNVIITATHSWVGDVQFTLGNGTNSSMVIDRPGYAGSGFGCSADNIGAQLNDEGTDGPVENQCSTTPPALFGQPTPNNPLSVFDGQPLAGAWTLAVRDNAGGDTGVLQSWCLVGTVAVPSGPAPALTLEKTVGTNPAICATSDTATVAYNGTAYYCYKATNTGNISLTTHSLVDNRLGTLLTNQNIVLPPLASTFITAAATITSGVVNSATWTASYLTYTVSASDMATVTVIATPTIALNTLVFSYTQGPNTSVSHPLVISNSGLGSTLNWVITETPTFQGNPSGVVAAPGSTATDRAHAPAHEAQVGAPTLPLQAALLPPTPTLNEDFADVTVITTTGGWYAQNNSNPVGGTNWFQGNSTVFPAQSGAATAYVGANYNNTTGSGTISNWLLTPELNLANGATFSFYTRKTTTDTYPDRLQVRLSTNGASTNVGTGETGVGDFITLLLDINPTLVTGVYPTAWTQFTVTVSGLSGPTTGRIAFRYFVTNGGPTGANSDYIGIDTVTYAAPLTGCNAPSDIPWLSASPSSGSTLGGNTSTVNVTFNTTGLTAGNTYTGTLCVNSNGSNQPQISIPVTLAVGGNYSVTVLPTATALSGSVGSVVSYSVWITNTGDVMDTFDIGVSNTPAFTTTVTSPVGPLAPGAGAQVWVQVQIPANALGGATSTANLFVSSQGGGASRTFSLTTTAWRRVYLPNVTK